MKREIKFRALKDDVSDCTFKYGCLIYDHSGTPRIQDGIYGLFHSCIKGTEGQYTGLKDKNGKEIYEEDIVEDGLGERMLVAWDQFDAKWIFLDSDMGYSVDGDDCKRVKVVGNKWDTPELPKGDKH